MGDYFCCANERQGETLQCDLYEIYRSETNGLLNNVFWSSCRRNIISVCKLRITSRWRSRDFTRSCIPAYRSTMNSIFETEGLHGRQKLSCVCSHCCCSSQASETATNLYNLESLIAFINFFYIASSLQSWIYLTLEISRAFQKHLVSRHILQFILIENLILEIAIF